MSVSLAPDSQSVFSVKCIICEGRESCTCNQECSEATLRSHLCRSSARPLAQRTCPSVRAGYYCYGHHQRMTPNRNRGDPGPAQHHLASRCTTTATQAGKDVQRKARNRSKGWSSQEPNVGQMQNFPERVQTTTRGYFPAQQGPENHLVRRFQRKLQDCVTLTGFMFSDLLG